MNRPATGDAAQPLEARGRLGFWGLVAMAGWPLAWAMATAVGSAALSVAPFWFIYLMVAQALSAQPDSALMAQYAAWALGLLALRWALMAASHVLAHIGAFAVQHRLRLAMARRLGQVPLSFFAGRSTAALRRSLGDDVSALEGFLAHMLADAVAAAAVPVAALALLFLADWRLALASLLPLPLALGAQALLVRRTAGHMQEWGRVQTRIAHQMGQFVRGVHVIKSFGLDARSFSDLAQSVQAAAAWVARHARRSSLGWVVFSSLLSANLVVLAPLGAWLHASGSLDTATYVLFLLVAPAVLLPLLRLTFVMGEHMHRAQALQRIDEILRADILAPPAQPQHSVCGGQGGLAIELDQVRLCYEGRLALDGVSFQARAGAVTAIVGASGSGKSSVLRLLARLYEAESGSVRLGAVDVRDWPLDDLLAQMAMVMQEVVLFHGTVRDNLLMADPLASDTAMQAAARAARAHGFIQALPQGWDTAIGERGVRLSGGERQRLSIARALLKNAPVVLLDEATAHVDADNEAQIQQALAQLCRGRTVVMVAHRLRSIMHADHIVVLDKGRVVGQGRHAALLADCPVYQRLWHDHEQARGWSLGRAAPAPQQQEAAP